MEKNLTPENNKDEKIDLTAEESTDINDSNDSNEKNADSEKEVATESVDFAAEEPIDMSDSNDGNSENEENADNGRKVSTESVDFSADDEITVVEDNAEPKGKKLPVIIAICVLAVLVIISGIVYFVKPGDDDSGEPVGATEEDSVIYSGNSALDNFINEAMTEILTDDQGNTISREDYVKDLQQQVQEATTILSEDVGATSPHKIVENNTQNTVPENSEQKNSAEAQIKAFFNRQCYIQGASYSDGIGDPLSMSLDGDDFEVLTNLDGTEISVMKKDNIMYIKRPAIKQYLELTDSVMKVMGLEPEAFSFSFGDIGYEEMQSKLHATYEVEIDGKTGLCYEYVNDDQTFKFYAVDGQLVQIDNCDASGEVVMQILIDYFSESIPGDQMTLKGYEKSSMGAIFADLM